MIQASILASVLEIKKVRLAAEKRRLTVASDEERQALQIWESAVGEADSYIEATQSFLDTAFAPKRSNSKTHVFLSEVAIGYEQSVQLAETFSIRAQHHAKEYSQKKALTEKRKQDLYEAERRNDQFQDYLDEIRSKTEDRQEQGMDDEIAELFIVGTRDEI